MDSHHYAVTCCEMIVHRQVADEHADGRKMDTKISPLAPARRSSPYEEELAIDAATPYWNN